MGMKFFLDWLQQRKDARQQLRFEHGFASAMVMYFHQELPLEYIADSNYQLSSAKADPWEDGYDDAVDMIKELEKKLNGPLF